jgi:dihydroorotate dehydrogenase
MSYRVARSAGFRMDPERAHHLGLRAVRLARPLGALRRHPVEGGMVEAFGLVFRNRVGLAAGYDKDGTAWRGLAALGFGHIEVGTVTPRPQPGNPRPRITRYVSERALVNRMGFPSEGAEAVMRRLDGRRPRGLVLGVSIGPNADTPPEDRPADYLALVDRFSGVADYLAVNVSSPNTAGLRSLQGEALEPLLRLVTARAGRTPVLVKLSPDLDDIAAVAEVAGRARASGLIVGNTTTTRPGIAGEAQGGLSGAPLGELALRRLVEAVAGTRLPVIASGGIMSLEDAAARIDAGAVLVQVYTGLVYGGPRLVRRMARLLG